MVTPPSEYQIYFSFVSKRNFCFTTCSCPFDWVIFASNQDTFLTAKPEGDYATGFLGPIHSRNATLLWEGVAAGLILKCSLLSCEHSPSSGESSFSARHPSSCPIIRSCPWARVHAGYRCCGRHNVHRPQMCYRWIFGIYSITFAFSLTLLVAMPLR